ncbi:MAG: hypothetical protein ACE5FS_15650 [Paracoccaceae bacterium]
MGLAKINAVWIGAELGAIHAACLASFLRHGHEVVLHAYEEPRDVPRGVIVADADELLLRGRMFRHKKTGSLAPFVDLMRYEILSKGLGLYVDCDIYCLKPMIDADYIFGWQVDHSINNAVLKLPVDCPTLRSLSMIKDMWQFLPPWESWKRRLKWRFQYAVGKGRLRHLPYGSTGPYALTWFLRKYGLLSRALPQDVFYPLPPAEAARLLDPGLSVADIATPNTVALHLYNEALHRRMGAAIPDTSPLGEIVSSLGATS